MIVAEARTILAAAAADPRGEGLRPLPTMQQAFAVVAIELLDRTDDPKYSSGDPLIKRLSDQAGLLGRSASLLQGFLGVTHDHPVRKAIAAARGPEALDTLLREAHVLVDAIDERIQPGGDAGRLQSS